MDQRNEPAEIKYTKQMLEYINKDIVDKQAQVRYVDQRLFQFMEELKQLKEARIEMLKELRKFESECCEPYWEKPNVPIKSFVE